MRYKKGLETQVDFFEFKNPWTGLAAMILVQAAADLEALGNCDSIYRAGNIITRKELDKFFRSRWAWHLATSCGLDEHELAERGVLTWASA